MLTTNPAFSLNTAPKAWQTPKPEIVISESVLYLPIVSSEIIQKPIVENKQELVDLKIVNHPRIRPLASFDEKYQNSYLEFSKVRQGLYEKLLKMLDNIPDYVGIAYFEGYRPLYKQKQYFEDKFNEILQSFPDKKEAYVETCKLVSPIIDNIPVHCTGAAIDMTLFKINKSKAELLDMGKFDVIFGPNDQQETFSPNTTDKQRKNRLLLLSATAKAELVNYGYEWWHFSYGDRAWAYVKQKPNAIYSWAENSDINMDMDLEEYLASL